MELPISLPRSQKVPQIHVMHYVNPVHKLATRYFVTHFKVPTRNVVKGEFWIRHSCLSVRPSVRMQGKSRVPLGGFPWNFSLGIFFKICLPNPFLDIREKIKQFTRRHAELSLLFHGLRIAEHVSPLFK
jgi:hypothetical protein